MRNCHLLAFGVAIEAFLFLACGTADEPQAPMIADCTQGCSPALSGGTTSGQPDGGHVGDEASADASTTPDGLDMVDVGVTGNDVFGDTPDMVDVGVSGNDVFAP